jgi:hypothetical protein
MLSLSIGGVGRQLVADHKSGDMSPHAKGDRRFTLTFEADTFRFSVRIFFRFAPAGRGDGFGTFFFRCSRFE